MCIIDCLSTIVFILPLHLDYTKVIILSLWWRNFQLEYWRTFQLVSTANHNTPYSEGLIKGVLTDMISCTKELILDGKNVKLDDLAIFSVGIVSRKGAASAADFTLADNVKGLKLRARATGELSNAQINLEGQLKEAYKYNVDGSEPGSENKPGGDGGEEENPLG